MSKLRAISLFTGAGGLDFGFEAAGFETAVAVEFDSRCVETLRANRAWPILATDVAKVTTKRLLAAGGLRPGEADVLIGGPPCQPFSKAGFWAKGETRRLEDPRSSTLDHYLRILKEARPRSFLLENVEGLGFRGKDEGISRIRDEIKAINASVGTKYNAEISTLNAADYGVPQLRRRLFVVGSRDGICFRFPEATHASPTIARDAENLNFWRTTWDALYDINEKSNRELELRGKWSRLLPSIPEGHNYLWHTDRGGGEPLFGWRRRFWSFLLKLAKDQPAWTLAAQPGPATGPFHWSNRRLSAREMSRIQTFPDDIVITGTLADAQRQLGNAVPSLMAEVLAREIAVQLLGATLPSLELQLTVPKARIPARPAEPISNVPLEYLDLRGSHLAHPGTGLGFRASSRAQAAE